MIRELFKPKVKKKCRKTFFLNNPTGGFLNREWGQPGQSYFKYTSDFMTDSRIRNFGG